MGYAGAMGELMPRAARLLGQASAVVVALSAMPAAAQNNRSDDPIIVVGQRNSAGLRADSEIDANAIETYGVDTVGDLLREIARETDPGGDGPVILINGQPASGIDEVADLPTEAVAKVQTLSRDAAATLGQRPTRRVINVVIRPDHRQLTLGATGRLATEGQGRQAEGTVNQLRLEKGNRRSLALRVTATDRLDEADRDIVSAPDELAANRFKSLVPGAFAASANGNITNKIGPSSVSLNLRGERRESDSRLGGLASDPARPLLQESESTSLSAAAIANGPLGQWRYSVNGNVGWRLAQTDSDRTDPLLPTTMVRDRARTRSLNAGLVGTLTGSPFTLPAGKASAAVRLEWRGLRATSTRDSPTAVARRQFRRTDLAGQVTLQLPLFADSPIGDLGAELSGALRHVTPSGRSHDLGVALNWRPNDRITLRASIDREQSAPSSALVTDPIVTIDNVRIYDFVRQETVLVSYITGGNRDLSVERRRLIALGATWRPIKANLNLTLDYSNLIERGGSAALPPVTAEAEAAFPDRFQRDITGRLIAVDARPVSFGLARSQELRTGVSFFHTFRGAAAASEDNDDIPGRVAPAGGTRVNAFFNHHWTLQSERRASAGLPVIDLLDGGALGYGGGQPRHRLQFGGGVVHRGFGLNVTGNWAGRSRIAAGTLAAPDQLRFASRMLVNARLFANLGTLLPDRPWARTLRVTLASDNLFDTKSRVRDSSGATPLGYQPYLLDPLGRTLSLSLRKAF